MSSTVQARIYDDQLVIWNEGSIPHEIKDLKAPHSSVLRNRLIADICFKAGYIDSWGRGIEKITTACAEHGCPTPDFEITPTGIRVTLLPKFNMPSQVTPQDGTSQGTATAPVTDPLTDPVKKLLIAIGNGEKSPTELRTILELKHRHTFRKNYMEAALEDGFIEPTIPEKPTSQLQKYRLTDKGIYLLSNT
jgi:ATP-dependent DNA helicase RecG